MGRKTRSRILKLLEAKRGRALSEDEIMKELGLAEKKRRELRETIENMVTAGAVKKTGKGRYRLAGSGEDGRLPESSSSVRRKNGNGTARRRDAERTKKNGAGILSGMADGRFLATVLGVDGKYFAVPRRSNIPPLSMENAKKGSLRANDLVVVELRPGALSAKVVERFGRAGEMEAEKRGLIREYSLPAAFPRRVTKEVESLEEESPDRVVPRRTSLEKETIFTIDGEDARDFDDAVGAKKVRDGKYRLWVNIADVSSYVASGSACDAEAARRATSTYLSDRVIPMLPERLSNDLCSLRPGVRRFTKTVEMDFDSSGRLTNSRIYNSVIKSAARLTYSEAWSALMKDSTNPHGLPGKIVSSLRTMRELYGKLRKRRIANGGLDFDFPEAILLRDLSGEVTDVARLSRNVAHQIIEEFMIMANSVVAGFIFRSSFESIYRIHEPPDGESVAKLREDLLKMGIKADFGGQVSPSDIQAVMNAASRRKDSGQVSVMILRALKKAVYSTKHVSHFGLAIDDYTHFTSPIRRYPDLVVHRIVDDILAGRDPSYSAGSLRCLAEHCSEAERRSEDAERRFMDLEAASFMKSRVGETFRAKVVSIHPFGIFVEVKEHFVEGLVPEHSYRRRGGKRRWFELGDEIRVELVEADMEKRRLTFDLVS